jgi:hypothetical protein
MSNKKNFISKNERILFELNSINNIFNNNLKGISSLNNNDLKELIFRLNAFQ